MSSTNGPILTRPCSSADSMARSLRWAERCRARLVDLRSRALPDVTVTNVFPGFTDTDMLAGVDAPKDTAEAVVREVAR